MRRSSSSLVLSLATVAGGACGGNSTAPDAAPLAATSNPTREVIDTGLVIDLAAMTGVATITLGPSTDPGASLETEGLTIDSVSSAGAPILFAPNVNTKQTDFGLAPSDQPLPLVISYHWKDHEGFTGISASGWTLDWPYYCGNMFPCHSQPSDGTTFTLDLQSVPAGKQAVFPAAIASQAPAYQLAWTVDDYTQVDLGTTTAGTLVSTWYRTAGTGEQAAAAAGTAHLVAAFDWLEKTIGPYTFGSHYGSVSVKWPRGAIGGMEHHPFIHIGNVAINDENTQVHEASHGWFGDGIRLQCWEDFVLSEGTVSYLANRALDVVAPGTATWTADAAELAGLDGTLPVWPQSCGQVDVIKDNLFTRAPYDRGEFFYKGIADKVGADKLDQAIAAFYAAHHSGTARMADMLTTIQQVTGYDPTACAQTWLIDTSSHTVPTPGPCP
jgi:aminopeptidase N